MPLTPYMQKNVLDWMLGGAAAVQPAQRWLCFATGTPNNNGASDGPMNSRILLFSGAVTNMAAANSPQGSCTNRSSASGSWTAAAITTVLGWNLYDTGPSTGGGTRLAWGTCSFTMPTLANSVNIGSGSLKLTLT